MKKKPLKEALYVFGIVFFILATMTFGCWYFDVPWDLPKPKMQSDTYTKWLNHTLEDPIAIYTAFMLPYSRGELCETDEAKYPSILKNNFLHIPEEKYDIVYLSRSEGFFPIEHRIFGNSIFVLKEWAEERSTLSSRAPEIDLIIRSDFMSKGYTRMRMCESTLRVWLNTITWAVIIIVVILAFLGPMMIESYVKYLEKEMHRRELGEWEEAILRWVRSHEEQYR